MDDLSGQGAPQDPPVIVRLDGQIATVRMNRGRVLNALSEELLAAVAVTFAELDVDPDVRCIVLAGDERAFAAGADIKELACSTAIGLAIGSRVGHWERLKAIRTPVVAAVSGFCLGGGCELAMSCDLIVASENATFGQPETGVGLVPGAGGTQRLTRAVGKALAMDMVLTGRRLAAEEALAAGLVARVTPAPTWLDESLAVAAEIAARAPIAQRFAKEAVDHSFEGALTAGLEFERKALHLAFASADAKEGLSAFIEKRSPEWRSR